MTTETGPREGVISRQQFLSLPEEEGVRLELSRGCVVREPAPGPRHGQVAARFYRLLWEWGEEIGLGLAFFHTAFTVATNPDTVRVPDVSFVTSERVPEAGPTDRPWAMAPDLAVEVVSPTNLASEIQEKALQYLEGGSRLIWIADPSARTVTVYRSRTDIRILTAGETLDGGELLPELRVPVETLFA